MNVKKERLTQRPSTIKKMYIPKKNISHLLGAPQYLFLHFANLVHDILYLFSDLMNTLRSRIMSHSSL